MNKRTKVAIGEIYNGLGILMKPWATIENTPFKEGVRFLLCGRVHLSLHGVPSLELGCQPWTLVKGSQ